MTTSRRLATLVPAAALLTFVAVAAALPAHADVPVGFSPDAEPVNPLHVVLVVAAIPILLLLVIVAAVYVPSLARGEDVTPVGTPPGPDQWLGGPRKGTAELAGPDSDETKAGGARGTW